MSYNLITTPEFESQAKSLAKRHRSLKSDLAKLFDLLREDPFQGVELKPGIRKIRMAITSKGKGKSGGARVITYTIITPEDKPVSIRSDKAISEGRVYLMSIYDKSDYDTINADIISEIIKELM